MYSFKKNQKYFNMQLDTHVTFTEILKQFVKETFWILVNLRQTAGKNWENIIRSHAASKRFYLKYFYFVMNISNKFP